MKKTRINKGESARSEKYNSLQRRDFFKLLGGGIFIFFQPWNPLKFLIFRPNSADHCLLNSMLSSRSQKMAL
jgi:hypothetical protein